MDLLQKFCNYALVLVLSVSSCQASAILFQNGTVITWNSEINDLEIMHEASVLVTDDRITGIYSTSDAANATDAEVIDVTGKIVTPGFVDTHHHLWQSQYRTIGSNTTLAEYLQRFGELSPASTVFTADDIYVGEIMGVYEALDAGVTTIVDHAHHTWSNETAEAGLVGAIDGGGRVFWCFTVHELDNGYAVDEQIAKLRELAGDERLGGSSARLGLSFDGWANQPDTVRKLLPVVNETGVEVLTTHYVGGPWNYENSPSALDTYSLLDTPLPIIFSHAIFSSQYEYGLLTTHSHFASIVPESDMHYGIGQLSKAYIQPQAALGVDTHFTYSADMVSQARLWLQSSRALEFERVLGTWNVPSTSPVSVKQAFLLITRKGGQALRRDDIGVLREGVKADLVVFDGDAPNMIGWRDPVAAVILHSHVGNVRHVLVDGEWRKKDFVLLAKGNVTENQEAFVQSGGRIQDALEAMEFSVLEGDYPFAVGGVEYEETKRFDVTVENGTGY
ncbi:amidohydrolase family protein [Lineolata rhizophorae]|uniref:Amidohydrolase family protein n=1 Tax=Lineolata rhizophorae TaxID=578093 RepID=A0A6A6P2G7_9PEZI|nr:amidohydrolase family protein [Lineolata rhizophorae]